MRHVDANVSTVCSAAFVLTPMREAGYMEPEKMGRKLLRDYRMGSGESPWGYTEAMNREKKIARHIHGVS